MFLFIIIIIIIIIQVVGRFVVGFGVSLSAIAECIYISEIAPPVSLDLKKQDCIAVCNIIYAKFIFVYFLFSLIFKS